MIAGAPVAMPPPSFAHDRSASYATWTVDEGGADVELRIDGRDLTRPREAAAGPDAADLAIIDALAASRGGRPCVPLGFPVRMLEGGGRFVIRWRVACESAGTFAIDSALPARMATPHLAFTKVRIPGVEEFEVVLHDDRPRWEQPADKFPPAVAPVVEFFRLGLCHIAGGLDHLFFLFGLIIAAGSLSEVAVVVTAFTLAHALTLAAVTLGALRPAAPAVEALIAVSIALLAVENLTLRGRDSRRPVVAALLVLTPAGLAAGAGLGRVPIAPLVGTGLFAACYLGLACRYPAERRLRWLVAFSFGLLHGFGFAGALVESGFAGLTVAVALLAFHAGVETGQLLFVASIWPLMRLVRRRRPFVYDRFLLEPASVALLAAAVFWYTARAFG